ncbi:MAG TPA: hypothetical protein VH041_11525 [Caldimonas sp.]|nr:hypothetical protein [Caldimonas sp.]HEX4234927.1 hypothetical protein [Caldimonas sp.]
MRETQVFEIPPRRFWVWRSEIGAVALAAVAAVLACAVATVAARDDDGVAVVVTVAVAVAVAVVLPLATVAVAASLARLPAGVVACRDGGWSFTPEAGPSESGPLAVAIDLGPFLHCAVDPPPRQTSAPARASDHQSQ